MKLYLYFVFFQIRLKNITFYIWLINLFFKGRSAGSGSEIMIPNSDEAGNLLPGHETSQVIGYDHQNDLYSVVNRQGIFTSVSTDQITISPLHLEVDELDKPALKKV